MAQVLKGRFWANFPIPSHAYRTQPHYSLYSLVARIFRSTVSKSGGIWCCVGATPMAGSKSRLSLPLTPLTLPSYTKSRVPPHPTSPTIQSCSTHIVKHIFQVWWSLVSCRCHTDGSGHAKPSQVANHTLVLAALVPKAHATSVFLNFQ